MVLGIFSLLSASLFLVMDGVDVAITEAAVGAGISTILMLAALALTQDVEKKKYRRRSWMPVAVVAVTGAALLYGTLDMPAYGDPEAPIHNYMAPHFLSEEPHEINEHIPNVVTAVLNEDVFEE